MPQPVHDRCAVIFGVVRGIERLTPAMVEGVPLAEAVVRTRVVPVDGVGVLTVRTLGITFGD